MSKTDWSIGLIVLGIFLISAGLVLPLHTLKSFTPHEYGGDATTYIEAQPLQIQEKLYVDDSFIWMRNSSYSQFYESNKNSFTDVIFSGLGMLWIILLMMSIIFAAMSIIGRSKDYHKPALLVSFICVSLALLVFVYSYSHMLSSIAGHASLSGEGVDSISGVQWTSTLGYGLYLPLMGMSLFSIVLLNWSIRKN
jgi:hypothetical protein